MSTVAKINSSENPTFPHILCKSLKCTDFIHHSEFFPAHATKVAGLIFLSGQTPVDVHGVVVPGGIKEHTVGNAYPI